MFLSTRSVPCTVQLAPVILRCHFYPPEFWRIILKVYPLVTFDQTWSPGEYHIGFIDMCIELYSCLSHWDATILGDLPLPRFMTGGYVLPAFLAPNSLWLRAMISWSGADHNLKHLDILDRCGKILSLKWLVSDWLRIGDRDWFTTSDWFDYLLNHHQIPLDPIQPPYNPNPINKNIRYIQKCHWPHILSIY